MTTTPIDLTTDSPEAREALKMVPIATIDRLRQEAAEAGDEATVALCDRAADGFYGHLYEDERVEAMTAIKRILSDTAAMTKVSSPKATRAKIGMQQAPKPPRADGETASDNLRQRCAALLNGRSERQVVAALRTNRQTFARILAGLPVRAGSLTLVRQELDRIAASEQSSAPRPA